MYEITSIESSTPVTDLSTWLGKNSDNHLEYSHDQSMLTLANPDDSILVVGPPRLSSSIKGADFTIVGFTESVNYRESSNIQPLKAVGSRRHIFSRTNQPVSGNISRMMILGVNLLRILYAQINTSFVMNSANRWSSITGNPNDATWFANMEEDLFRIPFGMGVIYSSPGAKIKDGTSKGNIGAEYIESCVLVGKDNMIRTGQTMIMENVSFIADRVMIWQDYSNQFSFNDINMLG